MSEPVMKRMNIRISGLGGQGAVTAAHLLAMAGWPGGGYGGSPVGHGGQQDGQIFHFQSIFWSGKTDGSC
jgi:hypothetical protein